MKLNLENLRSGMKRRKMTITDLSLLSGLHRNTIRNLLEETSDPTLSTVSKLADSLDMSPFALLVDVGEEEMA